MIPFDVGQGKAWSEGRFGRKSTTDERPWTAREERLGRRPLGLAWPGCSQLPKVATCQMLYYVDRSWMARVANAGMMEPEAVLLP